MSSAQTASQDIRQDTGQSTGQGTGKDWVMIDAENMVVGRLASLIAARLRGKHQPHYAPHLDCGDHVVVINADKIALSGKKMRDKRYYRHTGYPGGIKETSPEKLLEGPHSERVLQLAVKRMLPRGPLARQQLSHLRIYASSEHPHKAQEPKLLAWREQNRKNLRTAT